MIPIVVIIESLRGWFNLVKYNFKYILHDINRQSENVEQMLILL